jgi:predicted RNA-binding protein with PIN domain
VGELLIVDGDNLAHRLESSAERRRGDLVTAISAYAEQAGIDVIVVFDGHGRDRQVGRIAVRYAEGETADSVIERLCGRQAEGVAMTVVSSDTVLRHVAHRGGVEVMSAREFLDRLKAAPPPESRGGHPRQRFQLGDAVDPATRAALEEIRRRRESGP